MPYDRQLQCLARLQAAASWHREKVERERTSCFDDRAGNTVAGDQKKDGGGVRIGFNQDRCPFIPATRRQGDAAPFSQSKHDTRLLSRAQVGPISIVKS